MYDKYKKIYYTNIEDAERKIIQYHKERETQKIYDYDYNSDYFPYFPYEMFKSLIKSDERTLEYNFNLSEISEISSADGSIKLYKWIYGNYATMGENCDGILTYKSKGQYIYHQSEETEEGFHLLVVPTNTYRIASVTLTEGNTIFLFFAHHKFGVSNTESVSAYILSNQQIEPYHLFMEEGDLTSTLKRSTSSSGVYNGGIEYKNGLLTISQEGHFPFDGWAPIASGYKDVYIFNGQRFVYSETIYDNEVPLNIKLRNFKFNVVCLDFLPWKIRIDKMLNGSYRYASWKNKEMEETPDLIINNGEYRETKIDKGWQGKIVKFIFKNKEYEYIVTYELVEYNRFNDLTPISLVIKKKNKLILNKKHKQSDI